MAFAIPIADRRAADLRRRDGQERPVPAPRLAARRDGGPDPGVRPHPRGHDGQRRRLPRRPRQPALRRRARRRWSSSPGIGIFTAILAASIAMTQTDIKRVLAYSTLSQLGYMFAALGVGAFTAAIFHLMTHGFFKGLLFLGSGSVIHAVHEEQDMRRMGGLSKKIPITYATMLIGSLAIAGHPAAGRLLLQGRDPRRGVQARLPWVWLIGFVVAGMTAFYMFRLMGLTFWGDVPRPEGHLGQDPRVAAGHDDPADPAGDPVGRSWAWSLGLPLGASTIHGWLEPVFHEATEMLHHEEAYAALRHRRRPHPRERDGRRRRASPSPGGCSARNCWACSLTPAPGARPRAHGAGSRSSTGRRSTSGGSTSSTTCCSSSSAAGSPTRCGGSIARSSTGRVNAIGRGTRSRRVAGSAASRPAASRTTRWASPSA